MFEAFSNTEFGSGFIESSESKREGGESSVDFLE